MEELHSQGGNEGARLDTIKYTTVIGALARGGHPGAAEQLLRKMLFEYQSGNLYAKPEIKTFHAVLSAWSHYQNAEVAATRAQNVIVLMWSLTDDGITPDTRAYNSVLFCLKSAKAPIQAEACLREMESFGVAPSRPSYDSVIETWQNSDLEQADIHISELRQERHRLFGSGRNGIVDTPRRNRYGNGASHNRGSRFRKW